MTSNKKKQIDLGLKVGSKLESIWTQIRDNMLYKIEQNEIDSEINKVLLDYSEHRILEEKEKFQKDLNQKKLLD